MHKLKHQYELEYIYLINKVSSKKNKANNTTTTYNIRKAGIKIREYTKNELENK